jgi:hypothetical protein
LKKILLYILCLVSPVLSAQEKFDIAQHPRLLLKAGEEELVAAMISEDEPMAEIHRSIVAECDEMLALPVLERVMEGKRLLHTSREALRRIFWLSYSYRMTGEEAYADRAIEEMMAVCSFTDWNPSHFLDVGEMVMAVAIGYDWLYDRLSPSEKRTAAASIVNKGFIPADDERYAGFYNVANNWNQVCCSGLLYGALATYEEHPELTRELVDLYVRSVPFALKTYAPDGGYPEGFNYWGYGTTFQVLMIAALESALGTDFGLSDAPGFLDSSYFVQFMTAPSGDSFNFSDARPAAHCNPAMFWFAAKTGDLSRVWLERSYVDNLPEDFMDKVGLYFAEPRLLPSLLIFSSMMDIRGIRPPKENIKVFDGLNPVFIYREGWKSRKDAYLGIKAGTPRASHAHMDVGSFVYEYEGVRWSVDLGMQEYYSLEKLGIGIWEAGQKGQRWEIFRIGNESHSTLTLNRERHVLKSAVPFTDVWKEKRRKGAEMDMTSLFGNAAQKVVRAVWLDRKNHLHVRDDIEAGQEKVDVMWVMNTSADAVILPDGNICLEKNGKRMKLQIDAKGMPVTPHVWSNEPPRYYDAPNPGTCRVGFTMTVPAGEIASLDISLTPVSSKASNIL